MCAIIKVYDLSRERNDTKQPAQKSEHSTLHFSWKRRKVLTKMSTLCSRLSFSLTHTLCRKCNFYSFAFRHISPHGNTEKKLFIVSPLKFLMSFFMYTTLCVCDFLLLHHSHRFPLAYSLAARLVIHMNFIFAHFKNIEFFEKIKKWADVCVHMAHGTVQNDRQRSCLHHRQHNSDFACSRIMKFWASNIPKKLIQFGKKQICINF